MSKVKAVATWVGLALGCVALAALIGNGYVWKSKAEDSHEREAQNTRQLPQIVKALDDIAREKEAELEAQKKVREYIASQCRAGLLRNKTDCAAVGVPIE